LVPEESFSIFTMNNNNSRTKINALFGVLPEEIFNDTQLPTALTKMAGTYGLYCDNVYLKGTLVTEDNNYITGMST
jgi:hypothetical protein